MRKACRRGAFCCGGALLSCLLLYEHLLLLREHRALREELLLQTRAVEPGHRRH